MQSNSDKNLEFIEKYILPNIGLSDVDGIDQVIKKGLDKGEEQFSFSITGSIQGKQVSAEYTFSKSETNPDDPNYYFSQAKGAVIDKDGIMEKEQQFKVVNQRFVNMEKMLGLMNGNAVHYEYFKKGERTPSQGYLQVDVNGELQLYANSRTNFNLVRALGDIPLHKMTSQQKEKMIFDINNGVTPVVEVKMLDGTIQKAKLEIHPKIGAVLAKDLDGKRLRFSESAKVISEAPKLNVVVDGLENKTPPQDPKLSDTAKALIKKGDENKKRGQKNNSKKNSQKAG